MRQIYKNKITWIDIISPDQDDIKYLQDNYHFHPLILKELESGTQRNKAEVYDDYIFLVTHFPIWDPQKQISQPWELDVIISNKILVTVSYNEAAENHLELLEQVYQKDFEQKYLTDTVKLLHFIFEQYLDFALRQLNHIQEKINLIEEKIFQNKQQEVIPFISFVKRDILNFHRIFNYLKEDLASLARRGPRIFGEESAIYFNDLIGDSLRVENIIDNFKDTLEALENTNNSMIENKINMLTRIYTILSFITWPALLVISSYQMNTNFLPLKGYRFDFFIVLAIAFLPSIIIFIYLKRKKLL